MESDASRHSRRAFLGLSSLAAVGGLTGFHGSIGRVAVESEPVVSFLDDRIPTLLERYDIPGAALALVTDGEVTWSGAYGYADRETERPMTTETVCRLQSITKSVTAWGVMQLVERDRLDLDVSVQQYIPDAKLPETKFSWQGVTARRLLSHTAGLPEGIYSSYTPGESRPSLEAAVNGEASAPPARPVDEPGTVFRYSNPGYVLLELLIEEVTERDYAAYIQTAVFEPLGMEAATFEFDDILQSGLATSYKQSGEPVPPYREAARAHGMLSATVTDVATFLAAGMAGLRGRESAGDGRESAGDALSSESIATLYAPEVETTGFHGYASDAYGLGHFVETLPDGQQAVAHGGQGAGSWTWYHSVPDTGDGIVILTNSERSLRLIADVVGEWAHHRGFSSVSLTRTYSRVETAVRVATGIFGVAALGGAWRLGGGLRSNTREFAPSARRFRLRRILIVAVALTGVSLWWSVGYPTAELFLPGLARWLGGTLSIAAVVLFLLALFPRLDGT